MCWFALVVLGVGAGACTFFKFLASGLRVPQPYAPLDTTRENLLNSSKHEDSSWHIPAWRAETQILRYACNEIFGGGGSVLKLLMYSLAVSPPFCKQRPCRFIDGAFRMLGSRSVGGSQNYRPRIWGLRLLENLTWTRVASILTTKPKRD